MWEFQLSNIEDLERLGERLDVRLEAVEDVSVLAEPVQVGELVIPNSLAVHPMEGCDGDSQGRPGKLTLRRYERFAAGGAGLIWGEATAVVPEGRANPRQLWLHEKNKDSFAAMVKMMRKVAVNSMGPEHRPVIVLQLTHSGRYSKPEGVAHPMIAQRDPYRDPLVPQQEPNPNAKSKIPDDWPIVTDEYLDELIGAYVKAARIAFEVGFDAVDVKSCHGYLINELFACRNRKGKYGGSFENRTRFVLEVIDKIHKELGEDKPVVIRLGVYDAIPYPYGWAVDKDDYRRADLTEPKKLIGLLQERGVNLINVTIANPYYNPHMGRPFNETIVGGYEEPEHPLVGVNRLVSLTGEIQKKFPDIAIVGTGYSWLRTLFANVAAANKANGLTTLVGAGRMAFAYPDFAKDIITAGRMFPGKVCVSCSACTQIMRDAGMTGCVVRDNEVYGPIFEHGRMSDRDNLLRLASPCRKCQEPTCQLACPAGVGIPKFISLFLDGEDRAAYEVLREANVFPEVCAWLCPVEQQCEGSCLQAFIGDGPLPIADIQRYLAKQANKNGWSKLRIPQKATGKNVAVIGAGPAGLSCAAKLLEAGHAVTIFDKGTELGGMVESVIPPERQSSSLKNEITAVFADVPKDRMILRLAKELNADFNLDTISQEGFDAVFIGMGLPKSVSISDRDTDIDGVWDAMEFLSAAKEPGQGTRTLDVAGKCVAAIGGGNTAMDVALTAKRLGAKDVYVIYRRSFKEMPAWSAERDRAINEGVHFLMLTQPLGFNSHNGKLTAIKVCPTRLGEPDASGRRRPELVESSAYELDMDIVAEAIGQKAPEGISEILPGVELIKGLIRTKEGTLATSRPGVFAGGDLVRGPSTVVAAVADGMAAAKQINEFLKR
ncbi:MAG: oxidoreductase [Planctomycetota bacterium]|jgi:NADPH-dependent glutamate synthase beta subunit-like oxidoreductase/2,4-dienoyl-CoA reductase-like NADH-dependent reductase (Old Yellow Enzyme family)